jgi:methylglutaconyl-CoA hydratase
MATRILASLHSNRSVSSACASFPYLRSDIFHEQPRFAARVRQESRMRLCGRGIHNRGETVNSSEGIEIHVESRINEDGIVTLTLNRPKAANAMGRVMLRQWTECMRDLAHNDNVRCVVVTSVSAKVFSAGADLRERATMSSDEASEFVTALRTGMESLAQLPMPVICAMEGVAVGGGLELALAADWIICGQDARMGLVETSLAIVPGAGGTQRLSRRIGEARAKELIFRAHKIDSDTALSYGLVQHVVPAGMATSEAFE